MSSLRPTGYGYARTRRKRGPKNQPLRNVIALGSMFGKLHYLHPTKGWRMRRSPMAALLPRKA